MLAVFMTQWVKEKRAPILSLLFLALSIAAALLFGTTAQQPSTVDVFLGEELSEEETERWMTLLNQSETFVFQRTDERTAIEKLEKGRSDIVLKLLKDDYRLISAVQLPGLQFIEHYVQQVFTDEMQLRETAEKMTNPKVYRQNVASQMADPPLSVDIRGLEGTEFVPHNMQLQLLFGFTLLFVMFTVGFKLNAIAKEKVAGIWDRLIVSPVHKSGIYTGHLLYAWTIGIVHVLLIFLLFHYVFSFELNEHLIGLLAISALFLFTVVSMTLLIAGMTRTPEQFDMIFPVLVPLMPLISGVYMPPGAMTNDGLLLLAEFLPLTHAMEAMLGLAVYDQSLTDLFLPLAKLLLMAVLFMGIGMNLVERKALRR
ncbi:ABC transporter permease [Aureibacillus halotolerans]|uniref:ABC-2 type transport system permease protein n=1 Tax=Aureibacillus halotolerans TaxID=1508390 RepID=A0A4R6TW57_9BACI|nr:ABC transporter permease [Aureibacillus halotolerans]TDQ36239.1 ABC-2 type transport system permease protein [Aureibacillus halotolerans]